MAEGVKKVTVKNISNNRMDFNFPDRELSINPFQEDSLTSQELETGIVQVHIRNRDLIVKY